MSMPSKANKENFRLLDLSSDEDSEDLQLEIIPNRKKKITRKRNFTAASQARAPEPNIGAEVQCALCWAVRGTLVLWLLMLTWICAALYDQVSTMRIDIAKVSTSSDSVGDALQVCHTAAKELRANASELSARLSKLELEHQELSKRMEQAASELASVSGQLSAAPKLADTPRRLAELQRTVADFGSQIKGFESALTSTKKQAVAASTGVDEIKTTLHELEIRANETIGNMTDSLKKDNELKVQVTMLNETLIGRIDALQTKVEEYNKQAMTPALATLAPGTTSAPPATTFVRNVTAVPTPVPPVRKPMKVVVGDT